MPYQVVQRVPDIDVITLRCNAIATMEVPFAHTSAFMLSLDHTVVDEWTLRTTALATGVHELPTGRRRDDLRTAGPEGLATRLAASATSTARCSRGVLDQAFGANSIAAKRYRVLRVCVKLHAQEGIAPASYLGVPSQHLCRTRQARTGAKYLGRPPA